jgi:diadenylate cyclase
MPYHRYMESRSSGASEHMRDALARVAPGTPLRDGIDRVVRSSAGALLVLSDDPDVLSICSGGFVVDAPYSPQRLSELAKMDGAIILSADGGRIARANVHLVPDPTVPTSETGTRHRTAERVARSLATVPVVSASEEMGVINVYSGAGKRQLQEVGRLLERANQALQTLERYKARLDDAIANLTAVEIEDVASLRDVVAVVQRGEMVHRIADEIETMIIELGVDARLLRLQLDELYGEIDDELDLVVQDYLPPGRSPETTLKEMSKLSDDDVPNLRLAAATLHREGDSDDLGQEVAPKGLRILHRVSRLPKPTAARIADHFGGLAKLQRATLDDLTAVDGVDDLTAQSIRETLARVTESTILDQYS